MIDPVEKYKYLEQGCINQNPLNIDRAVIRRARKLSLDDPGIEIDLASVYRAMGKFSIADRLYRKVLATEEDNLKYIAAVNLSTMWNDLGNQKKAIKYSKAASRLLEKFNS